MAKKAKKEVTTEVVAEQEIMDVIENYIEDPKPVVIKEEPKTPKWEIKDRNYFLLNGVSPLSYVMRSKNIFYFDEELGYERELKLSTNQRTPFVDEFKGDVRLEHIMFRNGHLFVPKNKQTLQKLLSLYHPELDKVYTESKPVQQAANDIDYLMTEIDAMNAAKEMSVDDAEGVLRVEIGSSVSNMTSKEIRRDILLLARREPFKFLALANDDNVQLRNFGVKAVEAGMIKLSQDQRTFSWGSNGRKLLTIPFNEHPYSALAAWFKTDEGMAVYSSVEKQLK